MTSRQGRPCSRGGVASHRNAAEVSPKFPAQWVSRRWDGSVLCYPWRWPFGASNPGPDTEAGIRNPGPKRGSALIPSPEGMVPTRARRDGNPGDQRERFIRSVAEAT